MLLHTTGSLNTATRNSVIRELPLLGVGATSPGGLLELVGSFSWILERLRPFILTLHTIGSSLNLTLHLFVRLYFVSLQTVCVAEKYK